jgi:hypothetical protein
VLLFLDLAIPIGWIAAVRIMSTGLGMAICLYFIFKGYGGITGKWHI